MSKYGGKTSDILYPSNPAIHLQLIQKSDTGLKSE